MRRPLKLVLELAAGIIPILFIGCGGSGSGKTVDTGSSTIGGVVGSSVASGGEQDTGGAPGGGGAHAGGASRAGGETGTMTGGAGATSSTSTPASAAGSSGSSSPGGDRAGALSSSTSTGVGGTSGGAVPADESSSAVGGSGTATRGTTASGGITAAAGASSSGGTSGSSATGGVTALGGSHSGPAFPARFVGNVDARNNVPTDFPKYWDQLTPENAGKWATVQMSSRDTFNWTTLDAMYKYAEEHALVFKESSFIWGSAQPSWINNTNIMEVAKNWMKTFCDRYPKTRLIDVVMEPPPHTTPFYVNGLGGGNGTTWDWIANSFKLARESCPDAILLLNDYYNCEYAKDAQHTIDIVTAIQKLDAPIDAVGCQGLDAANVALTTFKSNLDRIASETGLPVYITEFDINLADDEKQRVQYAEYFPMFWDNPNVKGVTVWGYVQGATWRNNSYLLKVDGSKRPAMTWLMDFLKR